MATVLCKIGAGPGASGLKVAGVNFATFSEEISLNWNTWIRQIHRWLSIVFTVAVIINIIALMQEQSAMWVGIAALIPLILLLISGLYLFALPYAAKWRNKRNTSALA